jgi:class 3 adenylate cyclase/tetratricopeptide (TPR) repeat protein
VPTCAVCGAENRPGARFCDSCGSPLASPPTSREQRKTVTVLFCDVTGSTAVGERLDPETLRRVMARYFETARGVIERHGGTVEKFIGDAVMAVFGVPVVHEDDALRAVRAASELRRAFAALNEELEPDHGTRLEVRIGVNTGEVVTGTEERLATGDVVNVAARLEQAAPAGELLLGAETVRLVRDAVEVEELEPLELKGKADRVPAYRLLSLVETAPAPRLTVPLVGRARELRLLGEAFERAVSEPTCQLFTILGAAGVGKSRLAAEFADSLPNARVVRGRCPSYGEGVTYRPVVEALRVLGVAPGLDPLVRSALLGLLGEEGGQPAAGDELAWAFRKLLEAAAAEQPLVWLVDDLQWADPMLLELLEHVADLSRDAPVLLLCLARPELLERRPGWGGGKLNATSVLLQPLAAEETDELVEILLGGEHIDPATRDRIVLAAEGNPLFVEEMLAIARESPGEDLRVPPTIKALLAARLDQLPVEERDVLARAAVEGKVFHRGAVEALGAGREDLGGRLTSLVRKELVRPDRSAFAGEDAFRFRHQLIRDAAYEALPKATRADLHERFAGWLEERADQLVGGDEILGYHFEHAYFMRVELGPVDDHARELAAAALRQLTAATRRLSVRADMKVAVPLLRRTVRLASGAERTAPLIELSTSLLEAGAVSEARAAAQEAVEAAAAEGDRVAELRGRIQLATIKTRGEPEGAVDELLSVASEALPVFEGAGDHVAQSDAWLAIFSVEHQRCKYGASAEAAGRSREHARRAADPIRERSARGAQIGASFWGPMPVEDVLALVDQDPEHESRSLWLRCVRAMLEGMRGNVDEARSRLADARAFAQERGRAIGVTVVLEATWIVETLADDHEAARQAAQEACLLLESMGERGTRSTLAGRLALSLAVLGRIDEAAHWARVCELTGASDDVANRILVPRVRARIEAARGDLAEAERLGREAVDLAVRSDMLDVRADAVAELAETLALAGRAEQAAAVGAEALELYERKGNVVMAERMRTRLAAGAV